MKRSEAVKAATNGVSRAWHHSERNSYPGTSPLLTSVINELRKGVRHATLRASVSAYRVVLFLTGSIRSYPPYKVGILRWTHEREHQKPTSSRAWIRRCAPALSCSPQDKHLEAFAFPLRAGCRLRAISGLQPLSGCAYQRARVHQHRAQPLALWLWTGPPTRQWKEAYLEKACLWHPVDNRLLLLLQLFCPRWILDRILTNLSRNGNIFISFYRINSMRFGWNFFFFFSWFSFFFSHDCDVIWNICLFGLFCDL